MSNTWEIWFSSYHGRITWVDKNFCPRVKYRKSRNSLSCVQEFFFFHFFFFFFFFCLTELNHFRKTSMWSNFAQFPKYQFQFKVECNRFRLRRIWFSIEIAVIIVSIFFYIRIKLNLVPAKRRKIQLGSSLGKCGIYSWLSLSRLRLSRITAYLKVKIWSLPKHETLTTGKNIVEKRSNFSSFPQYFQYNSNFKSNYTYICQMWLFELFFPQFCNSDMSKYGHLEVFQRVPWNSGWRESTVFFNILSITCDFKQRFVEVPLQIVLYQHYGVKKDLSNVKSKYVLMDGSQSIITIA